MRIFRALSALLSYPTEDMVAALDEIGEAIAAERLVPESERAALLTLVHDLRSRELYDVQEGYVLLFDRTRSLSLHLFEHVHGESRDRGQAMVDLRALYEAKGLTGVDNELPDFTPLFLEFLSTLDPAEALPLLAEPAHVFTVLAERLHKRQTPYEAVFRALAAMAKVEPDAELLAILRAEPDPAPDDLAALDAAYDEAAVDFSAPAEGDCGHDGLAAKLRQARRPAPGIVQNPTPRTAFTHSHSHQAQSHQAPEDGRHG
ncbi:nitrate reductase molybdenum cofactor assembly chaperone [Rhodoblastus sp.]|uniref:nitrate reductase molybdenum cofactor assembly chaperone n=1 Tax=Rhodoblastus sp. TaxID=1962975 RepID=UPI0035AF47D2